MVKQKKKINQNFLIFIITVFVFLTVFFTVQLVRFFEKPIDTVLIRKGEIIKYDEVTGYIIRNEELIDISSFDGIPKSEVEDATRVAKGAPVIKYVSRSEEKIIENIKKLDEKIDVAKESQQTILNSDVKILVSEIENNIYSQIKNNTSLDEIKQNKKRLNEKITKKAQIVGELSPVGSELKGLIEQRMKYETELNNSEKALLSPKAGLISYRIDGFENILTYDSISLLTSAQLDDLKISLDQVIPVDTKNVKIVNNFECYIAVPMELDESENVVLDGSVYLRFTDKDDLIPAKIEYISKEEDKTLVVFKINSNVEELTKYRKVTLDVVWWRASGLKVNKKVLFNTKLEVLANQENQEVSGEENDISGETNTTNFDTTKIIEIPTIKIKKAYSEADVFVKVISETDDFIIIDNYKDTELEMMGVTSEFLENRKTLKMFDEAVVMDFANEKNVTISEEIKKLDNNSKN